VDMLHFFDGSWNTKLDVQIVLKRLLVYLSVDCTFQSLVLLFCSTKPIYHNYTPDQFD
jgi:hypothetical protein